MDGRQPTYLTKLGKIKRKKKKLGLMRDTIGHASEAKLPKGI
jgi:hypothetical protein